MDEVGGGVADYEDEISLLDMASVVLRQRRLVVASTFVGVLLALVVGLTTSPEFTSSTSFLPNGGDSGGLSGAAGLAAQFGFSIPRSGGAERSPEFYKDLLTSREILDSVVESGVEVLGPLGPDTIDLSEHFEIEGESIPERNALTRRSLSKGVISVSVGRETGVVTASITTDDPELSAGIGRRLVQLIGDFDVETRQSQASAERGFAQARLEELRVELTDAEDLLQAFLDENRQFAGSPQLTFAHDRLQRRVAMRQELFTAMAQAYEQARIDEVRNTPVITIIDQPEAPALPDPRGRLLKLVLGLVLGLMVGFGLAFMREFDAREKRGQSEAYQNFQDVLSDVKTDPLGVRKASRETAPPPPPAD